MISANKKPWIDTKQARARRENYRSTQLTRVFFSLYQIQLGGVA